MTALTQHEPESVVTSTLVIGTGLGGLALASDLDKRGIACIVVDDVDHESHPRTGPIPLVAPGGLTSSELSELSEVTRQFRRYAHQHHLQVWKGIGISRIERMVGAGSRWAVHTRNGVVHCDNIVLTRWARPQLRELLTPLGLGAAKSLTEPLHRLGIFLLRAGESIQANHREILRQARAVSQALCNPGGSLSFG